VLDFKPSRRLTFALGCLLMLALLIVCMMPMLGWLRLLILAASMPIASYILARDVWLYLPHSLVRLELTYQGEIKLTRKNGQIELAQIMPSSYVTSSLTILHLKPHISRWQTYLLILPDSVSQVRFRQLRVWLLWGVVFNQKESGLSFHLKPIEENQGLAEEA
jgi:hypothetical protein